jgi:hypothetical protein
MEGNAKKKGKGGNRKGTEGNQMKRGRLTGGYDSRAPSADKKRTCIKPFSLKNLSPSCSTII